MINYLIAGVLTTLVNFIVYYGLVFTVLDPDDPVKLQAARLGTLFLEMGFMYLTVTVLQVNDKIAKVIVQVLIIVANYILSKLFVFRKNKGTRIRVPGIRGVSDFGHPLFLTVLSKLVIIN